jgi:hypothetical protein
MTTTLLVAALSARLFIAPEAPGPDPCQLVTPAEIAAALGSAPSPARPHGPSLDEETNARLTSCMRSVGKVMLDVSVAEFPDVAGATRAMTLLAQIEPADEDEAKMVAAAGVGDRSLFGATKIGAHWIAQRGKFVVSLTLAGELGNGAQYRESLKKLAANALTRL